MSLVVENTVRILARKKEIFTTNTISNYYHNMDIHNADILTTSTFPDNLPINLAMGDTMHLASSILKPNSQAKLQVCKQL
jgi:hypothetical protein